MKVPHSVCPPCHAGEHLDTQRAFEDCFLLPTPLAPSAPPSDLVPRPPVLPSGCEAGMTPQGGEGQEDNEYADVFVQIRTEGGELSPQLDAHLDAHHVHWDRDVSGRSTTWQRDVSGRSVESIWTDFSKDADGAFFLTTLEKTPGLRVWNALPTPGPLKEHYKIKEHLGCGNYGTVVVGKHLQTGTKRALKTIPLSKLSAFHYSGSSKITLEESIAGKVQHPYIGYLFETFRDETNLYLVMELCTGGDLFLKVTNYGHDPDEQRNRRGLPMYLVAIYMWQMLSGIFYLHHNGIVHRDIKLENYLLKSRREMSELKLIDFGFACEPKQGEMLTERVGSPVYLAPEVLSGKYDSKCDIYGIGICSYFLVTARMPFDGKTNEEVFAHATKDEVPISTKEWRDVPAEPQELITHMLAKDPHERPTAVEILVKKNSWLRDNGWDPNESMDPATDVAKHNKRCCAIS
mmetsp:Transcript_137992/g.440750  ORF Transcript_137992/g.440750 Transcript_137992/m.440750 type:complete len:461 (-) Transcript_137992:75-1457(-)